MKREEIEAILNDSETDVAGKVNKILNLRGEELKAEKARYEALESKYNTAVADVDKFKDYEAVLKERDTLLAEKAGRAMTDRFKAVVGDRKFLNTFTADGVRKAFVEATANPEYSGKTDEEIYKAISDGKEAEWYQGSVRVNMTPSAGRVNLPDPGQAYLDEKYANSKFYKP